MGKQVVFEATFKQKDRSCHKLFWTTKKKFRGRCQYTSPPGADTPSYATGRVPLPISVNWEVSVY